MSVTQLHRSTQLKPGSAYRVVTNDTDGKMVDAAAITAARALISDANGIPTQSVTTSTELGYVNGVTSAIQTQINAKKSIATGNAYKFETTDASGNLQETTVTASRAVATDANGLPVASATTATELGYVNGVTSAIQTQLNAKLNLSGGTMSGAIAMGTNKITGLGNPTADQDAATKFYVDSLAAGLDPKDSSRIATLLNIPGYVTGTITIPNANATYFPNVSAAAVIDGVTLVNGNRVLVKNQTDAKQNGIYIVTNAGVEGATDAVLDRASDMDGNPAAEVSGGNFTFVETGTQAGTGWVVVGNGILTLDTNNINWTQFSETGTVTYLAGAGLAQSGTSTVTFDVVAANTSLTVGANDVAVNLADSGGLEISSGVKIKPDTTTANTLAITLTSNGAGVKYDSNSFSETSEALTLAAGVAGAGLALTTGVLSVNVDGSTLEIPVDTLQVKDAGIKYAKTSLSTREVPSGTINGVNAVFTTVSNFTSGSEHVYRNGILQNAGGSNDYTVTAANEITFTAGSIPQTGDVVLITSWKS